MCLGSGFGCAPPLLAGVLGCVCVCGRAPLVPRHSWLGCAVWVCVLGLGFRLRPATPGWGVRRGCVCLGSGSGCAPPLLAGVLGCACSPCTPPLLAGVCGVGVCVWVRVSAAPRHSWLGCWGVCVLVYVLRLYPATPGWGVRCGRVCSGSGFGCAPPLLAGVCGAWVGCCLAPVPVPWFVACCARCPGLRHPVAVVAWHLSVCLGSGRRRASLACLVAPRWCAAPRPVRLLSVLRSAFPTPWCLSHPGGLRPRLYCVAARGTRRPAENRAHCACRWPLPRRGRWARSASYPFGAPRWGCPWRVPPASVLGCVRCGVLCVWTRSLTRPVSRTVRLSTGDSAGAPGLFRVDADTAPFGSEDATPGSRACVRVRAFLAGLGGPASRARFWCASPFPVAVVVALFVCSASAGLGLPCLCCLWVFVFFFPSLLCAPFVSGVLCFPAPGALGLGVLWSFPPPSLVCFFFFFPPPCPPFFFFALCLRVRVRGFSLLFFRAVLAVRCRAVVSWAVGRVGVCCCGPCAAAGAGVLLRSLVRFPLLCCSLFCCVCPVAPRWRRCSSACCLWWLPCGLVLGLVFFFCVGFLLLMPPPPPVCCPVLWVVVRRVVWCCGLWCVLCCVRCCVACLCSCAVLCWVALLCCCCALLSCAAAFSFSAGFFFAFFRCSLPFRGAVSVSVLCLCGAVLVCLCRCPLCAALVPLWRWLVFCVVVCCVCVFAVGPGCPLLPPGGSWCRVLVVCCGVSLGAVLRCVAARCAARRCVVSFCPVWCCRVVCRVLGRCPSSWGPVPSGAVFCRVSPRCVCFAVVCCCVVLLAAVCRAVRSLSSPPCAVLLWGPALPWCPAPLCCAPWCCAAVWCCGVPSCCFDWFVSCRCLVSPT